jgi:hypothetical protein
LPHVLYRYETWLLALRGEHTLRVSEKVLRRKFGAMTDETVDGWRKLHIEELQNLIFTKRC